MSIKHTIKILPNMYIALLQFIKTMNKKVKYIHDSKIIQQKKTYNKKCCLKYN